MNPDNSVHREQTPNALREHRSFQTINDPQAMQLRQQLEEQFSGFSAKRQNAFHYFSQCNLPDQKKIIGIMMEEQNQEYLGKLLGPKLRHCASSTKDFCIQWFQNERNVSLREEAIAKFEERLVIEEQLTYVFEAFPIEARLKFANFYESLYNEKEKILEILHAEKAASEKAREQAAKDREQTTAALSTRLEKSSLSSSEIASFAGQINTAKIPKDLETIETKIKELSQKRAEMKSKFEKQISAADQKTHLESFLKLDLAEQQKYLDQLISMAAAKIEEPKNKVEVKKTEEAKPEITEKPIDLEALLQLDLSNDSNLQAIIAELKKTTYNDEEALRRIKSRLMQSIEKAAHKHKKLLSPDDQTVIKQLTGKIVQNSLN